jgi:hypothetical protein
MLARITACRSVSASNKNQNHRFRNARSRQTHILEGQINVTIVFRFDDIQKLDDVLVVFQFLRRRKKKKKFVSAVVTTKLAKTTNLPEET